MKFIFPQNYDFNTKLFGLIDYTTAILNIIWSCIILILLNIVFSNLNLKIFLFIILSFPVLLFSVIGINGENIIYVASYLIKYFLKQKLYLYEKKS